jgi:hypothetical protein
MQRQLGLDIVQFLERVHLARNHAFQPFKVCVQILDLLNCFVYFRLGSDVGPLSAESFLELLLEDSVVRLCLGCN